MGFRRVTTADGGTADLERTFTLRATIYYSRETVEK